MHIDLPPNPAPSSGSTPWWRELNRYHWFVFVVAALGWLFDTMDQQLFNLARAPAMRELLGSGVDKNVITEYGGYATSIFLVGWAVGGVFFGILGDRIGRVKTMLYTILIYSLCTGLSAFSQNFWDFSFYRFLTGLGVGGEFAVGVSLVAEVMPERARPYALGLLQALSAVGNITAAVISIFLGHLEEEGALKDLFLFGYGPLTAWRIMFLIGTVPALLAILIRRRLKEPERWKAAASGAEAKKKLGSYGELFGDPRWKKNAIVGLILACSGVIGLWGIGFFSIDLQRQVFEANFKAEGMEGPALTGRVNLWAGLTSVTLNTGAFFGIYLFGIVSQYIGRKPTFAIAFIAAGLSTILVFSQFDQPGDVFWMIPLMGFCQLSLFGGYAIYFPELFPTRLRSTGISFCYNVGRLVAALGPTTLGLLTNRVYGGYEKSLSFRYAGMTMCAIFLVGLLALPFAPETKGKPLPE